MWAPDQTLEHKGHSVTVGGFDALLVRTVPAPQGQRTRGVPQGQRGSSGVQDNHLRQQSRVTRRSVLPGLQDGNIANHRHENTCPDQWILNSHIYWIWIYVYTGIYICIQVYRYICIDIYVYTYRWSGVRVPWDRAWLWSLASTSWEEPPGDTTNRKTNADPLIFTIVYTVA